MTTFFLYVTIAAAIYYLLAQAKITEFLWSRYPAWLDYYTRCAACSGFLYGVAVAFALGWSQDLTFLGLNGRVWYTPILVGLCCIVTTPIIANAQISALLQLGVPDTRADATPTAVQDES